MHEYGPNGRLGDPSDNAPIKWCDECDQGRECNTLFIETADYGETRLCPSCRGSYGSVDELLAKEDEEGLTAMKSSVEYALFEIRQRRERAKVVKP